MSLRINLVINIIYGLEQSCANAGKTGGDLVNRIKLFNSVDFTNVIKPTDGSPINKKTKQKMDLYSGTLSKALSFNNVFNNFYILSHQ